MAKTDHSENPNPFYDMWREYQDGFMKGQKSLYPGYEAMATDAMKQTMDAARESWSAWEKQAADWVKMASNLLPADMQSTGDETLASESLKRMFDPEFFAFAALDEASGSVQRMAEGPEFADIGFLEKHMLQSTAEWFAMREADAKYRQVTGAAWARAFQRFTSEMSSDWSRYSGDSRKVLDRWLEIANDELIKTQRQDDYLDASRKLFRATIEYRLKQRELTEIWCESQSIPTRTEVDDLHRTVTELRREVRALKRQHAGATTATSAPARSKKPGKKVAAAKKSARTRRNVAKAVKRNGDQDSADAGDVTVRDVAVKARSVRKKRAAKKATGKKSDAKNDPSPQSLDD